MTKNYYNDYVTIINRVFNVLKINKKYEIDKKDYL